ncbi:hypothetical protein PENCOP_c001G00093 [Penicillium coprophilum]|uniref:BOD1/SHG1 domain-containing protein n=1 Tax=Penicillium coprophilum TaxID=36646 RepID=A0A1V6V9U7_9EURO|nr:hypothetical protein PENCOP_c001G00093 [Penicillium coprophilum]
MGSDEAMANSQEKEDVHSTAKHFIDIESVKRKKFKPDDLPLSAAQHAVIDKLLHSFKKKGGFDSVRKQIWADFNDGEIRTDFTNKLVALAESEIDREPALLSRERGKAATLIEGAVDRGDVYKSVEDSIDQLASKHLDFILESVREIRCQDVGEEVAARELELGNKTDADYESYVSAQREKREKVWREEERKQREIEEEERRTREEERKKKRELERQKDEEDRARRKEIDEQRRADRERQREEQRILDEQRERERDERYERRRREDRERYRGWDRDRSRTRDRDRFRDRSPAYRSDRGLSPWPRDPKHDKSSTSNAPTPVLAPLVDEKSLEEAALQMLLKEGEELAAKARQKPEFDFEEAEAIENGLKPPGSTLGPAKSANDSRFSNTSTRAVSISRDTDPRRGSLADRGDRARHLTRDRSRSRSRRRRTSRYDTDRRRERSRDTSVRSRDRDMDARRGYRDFRDDRGGGSYRPSHRSRSRSAGRRERDRSVGRDRDRIRDRSRSKDRSRNRDRDHDNYRPRRSRPSRSPVRRRSRSRSRSRPRPRDRPRSRSRSTRRRSRSRRRSPSPTLDIDRYVPPTSNRSKSPRRRVRSPERERESRPRLNDIDRYKPISERDKDPTHVKEEALEMIADLVDKHLVAEGVQVDEEVQVVAEGAQVDEEVQVDAEAQADAEVAVAEGTGAVDFHTDALPCTTETTL